MKRRLFTTLAALSLLLCVSACVLWVRSYWVWEQWAFPPEPAPSLPGASYRWVARRYVESCRGRLRLIEYTLPVVDPLPTFGVASPVRYYQNRSLGDFDDSYTPAVLGFVPWGRARLAVPGIDFRTVPAQLDPAPPFVPAPPAVPRARVLSGFRCLNISWWLLATTTALLPIVWSRRRWVRFRRDRRISRNMCAACGYDLRTSPQRCPECGMSVPGAVSQSAG